jgi:hypothetical protein
MTDTPKKPKPAKRLPTREELLARGWKEAETPPGRGYFLPIGLAPTKDVEDPAEPPTPAKQPLTRAYLESLGFKRAPPSGRGFGLPAYVPPPKKKDGEE